MSMNKVTKLLNCYVIPLVPEGQAFLQMTEVVLNEAK